MKIKADKKNKGQSSKLHSINKSSVVVGKSKEKKKSILKLPAADPLSFAEKKSLAVKKKNKKEILEAAVTQPTISKKLSKKKKGTLESSDNAIVKHDVKKKDSVQSKGQPEKSTKKKKKAKQQPLPNELSASNVDPPKIPDVLVSKKTIHSALKACKKALDSGFEKKKNLFGEDLKYGLQIASVKIPDVPSRNCRVQLPHPIYKKGDDICLIVKDLVRGNKQDYEPTLHHWQDKLRELGIDCITQIIPFHQLKQDYRQYEMKLKLVHRFDRFLVDARINGHVYSFLGNGFIRRCKNPTPVVLEKDDKIEQNITKALGRFTYKQTNTGRITEIQFATHKMPLEAAVENAEALINTLKSQYPGGWLNIRTVYLKPMVDIPLTFPLYVSKIDPNLVPVPKIIGPRERFETKMNEKLQRTTGNKYKFQAGSLVRVEFDQRKKRMPKKKSEDNKDKKKVDENDVEEEDVSDDQIPEQASDTEQSNLDDDDD
ncbi:ribosomal L1 domain-containing protein CG13096-like [Topomyia yanbarensis]|uniref:ribosomal L1 domain-containing protein CG13096-like n=1 Tax=Topomyia yanbarensis TaxID=2498891 RepID=UPI00273B7C71|nr:ribosomal L1 domain-containing protein CG13096-like [Topomyia yanbarensis]